MDGIDAVVVGRWSSLLSVRQKDDDASEEGFSIALSDRRLVLNAADLAGEIYAGLLEPPQ